ncbi:MAG: AmpG family muropeptide MFS transporter [Thermodesulfobacteriota bacterium]
MKKSNPTQPGAGASPASTNFEQAAAIVPGARKPRTWRATNTVIVAFLMGYASGLPLSLTGGVLQAWMKDQGVDLGLIGLTALFGLPYSLKFLWSPFLDRFVPPFFGRRRGWLLVFQLLLMGALILLGQSSPARNPAFMCVMAVLTAFFSASQDIVVDAYRREDLTDRELGLGSSCYIYGYRVGMLLAAGGGLIIADKMGFSVMYALMAACLLPGIATTIWCREPRVAEAPPRTLHAAVFDPFIEYFKRPQALLILTFIVLYKLGDSMATSITIPFYQSVGFTKTDIGTVVKLFGFWAILGGTGLGGVLMLRLGIKKSLWAFGVLQGFSVAGFAILTLTGPSRPALAIVVVMENLFMGMGTAAFTAYMASIVNKSFTATQYALLTSIMAISRTVLSSPAGYLAAYLGWAGFFIICAVLAVPGLCLLYKIAPFWKEPD